MMVLVSVVVVLGLACGFLLMWGVGLCQKLRAALSGATARHATGVEKVTALKAAHGALCAQNRRLQVRLDDSQQELAALSYSISHDLRAPLRSIDGFSQALAEDYGPRLDATAQDYLRRVRTNALHLNALIDELLGLARIVHAPCRCEAVDLAAIARDVTRELAAEDPARRVEWSIPGSVPVRGDSALLVVALRHLLGNAWKFSAGRTVAHIGLRVVPATAAGEPEETVYEVSDDGVGFDMQYAGKLFGVFQRMHAAGEFAGSGVGLATVQRIVRRHGGRVWAAAATGQGAVFSFTLGPTVDEASSVPTTQVSPAVVAAPTPDADLVPTPKPSAV